MKKILIGIFTLAVQVFVLADSYTNELTGAFLDADWSKESNGLIARLCVNKTEVRLGNENPIFLLEVKNVSSKPIHIRGLLYQQMLLIIKPQKVQYTSCDVEWVFDRQNASGMLNSNECVRAVCQPPYRLVPTAGTYEFSFDIVRGPSKANGADFWGDDWWSGSLSPKPLTVIYK